MIFLEFLYYYGYVFDHSKFVIYAYPPNDNGILDRETINKFYAVDLNKSRVINRPMILLSLIHYLRPIMWLRVHISILILKYES
jgi:hypothetical protein